MAAGLAESRGYGTVEAADYLLGLCRMAEWWSQADLIHALESPE
jgi:hypothetical protein